MNQEVKDHLAEEELEEEQSPSGYLTPEEKAEFDQIKALNEQELADDIELNLLRTIALRLRQGTAAHQEMAIARALIKDRRTPQATRRRDALVNDPAIPEAHETELPDHEFPSAHELDETSDG